MPELPEVETVRAGLASLITGATVTSVEVRRDSCVRLLPGGAGEFAAAVTGTALTHVVRRGKFLWCELDSGEALSAHLGMSGQFRVYQSADAPAPHAHCRARLQLELDRAPLTLDFLDQRTFGYLHAESMVPTADGRPGGLGSDTARVPASVAHIARDALDPHLSVAAALRAMRRGSRGIKQVLLDQTVISGIGNIYADEALWLARVQPERPVSALSGVAARLILERVQEVMKAALGQGGTSFDTLYVNVNGESGYFERSLHAYGRGGEPCERCGRALTRASIGGRSTHWCPTCQRRWTPRVTTRRGPTRRT